MMSEGSVPWQLVTVDDIKAPGKSSIAIGPFGSRMRSDRYVAHGVPVIRGNNLSDARALAGEFVYVSPETADELRSSNLFAHDLVFPHRGAIGAVGIVPQAETIHRWMMSTSLMKLTCDGSVADPYFIFYYFRSPTGRAALLAHSSNVGTPGIAQPLSSLRSIQLCLPPLHVQRRIVSVLSAYDDLIENNTRRIQILEEMAQAIYREWFVEFRFPGRADTQMVESALGPIPEGWSVRTLADVADVNARTIHKGDEPREINYIDIASVSEGEFSSSLMDYAEAPSRARRLVHPFDVIWSTVRPNLRAFALICEPPPNCVASTGFAVISARSVPWSYLYEALTTDAFVGHLVNHATGAAYPAVTGRTFESAQVILPDASTLDSYHRAAGPMLELVAKLRTMSRNLRQARDFLLPRLISGEIDVANLDIGSSEPAA